MKSRMVPCLPQSDYNVVELRTGLAVRQETFIKLRFSRSRIVEMGFIVLDFPAELNPPAPAPRAQALGPVSLLRVLANNPIEPWTAAHFNQPIVVSGMSVWRVAVVIDPAAD